MSESATISAPFVLRGELVEGSDVIHRSRDLGVSFATPKLALDRAVHPRTQVPPLLNVPLTDIIDFLVQTGERIRDPQNHFMRECIDRSVALVEETARAQSVTIRREGDGADIPGMFLDRDQLVQVLLNVLMNALQAMPGGGTLTVRLRHTQQRLRLPEQQARRVTDLPSTPARRGPRVPVAELRIEDTGPGISPEMRGREFAPFATSRASGTGLGLPISLQIVRDHGGSMLIESPARGGTVVTIELPVDKRRGRRRGSPLT